MVCFQGTDVLVLGSGAGLAYGGVCAWLLEGTEARAEAWLRRESGNC
ncbi:hypothetical protein F383_30978 [Gossypium arboreum]|uniref:Uncharacterized protein n=1 Tax=Gossypium arboreum TaxID=29729 RepID=A0A0B0N370_GOSAR|nr:hypothetical protein F383_37026 [Gossypium arboreum]KHG05646.1 hypothetical protein F383_30978 [Gossypium arboreum]